MFGSCSGCVPEMQLTPTACILDWQYGRAMHAFPNGMPIAFTMKPIPHPDTNT
jgi:hypothetical protein